MPSIRNEWIPSSLAMPASNPWMRENPLAQNQTMLPGSKGLLSDRDTARRLKEQANTLQIHRDYRTAVALYQEALRYDPTYTDLWFNLAHTYISLGERPNAIEAFNQLLQIDPTDDEARQNLAEQYEAEGLWPEALTQYNALLQRRPRLDSARRQSQYLALRMWAMAAQPLYPHTALDDWVDQAGQANLRQARGWVQAFCRQQGRTDCLALLDRVMYQFAPTQQADHVANLAEYRHHSHQPVIRFYPSLAWADPRVLAAYWMHELEHAADGDGQTSITEEQDGYRSKVNLWAWASVQQPIVQDTNLDYALQLYRQHPQVLDERVARHYRMRDPHLAATSPRHPAAATNPTPFSAFQPQRWEQWG
ncbi:MAG: tetratricopeptide repeat protein [Vampirovibrionales bacterium]